MKENEVKIKNFHCSEHGDVKPVVSPKCPECTTPNPTNMEETTWEEDWRPQFYNRWYRGNEQHPHVMFAHHTMEDMLKDIEGIVKQAEQRGERKGREKLSWELIHTVGAVIPMSGESANNPEILARDIKEMLSLDLTPHNGEEETLYFDCGCVINNSLLTRCNGHKGEETNV